MDLGGIIGGPEGGIIGIEPGGGIIDIEPSGGPIIVSNSIGGLVIMEGPMGPMGGIVV